MIERTGQDALENVIRHLILAHGPFTVLGALLDVMKGECVQALVDHGDDKDADKLTRIVADITRIVLTHGESKSTFN